MLEAHFDLERNVLSGMCQVASFIPLSHFTQPLQQHSPEHNPGNPRHNSEHRLRLIMRILTQVGMFPAADRFSCMLFQSQSQNMGSEC